MINSKFFLGMPDKFKNICWVYPPKIKDILDEIDYPVYRKMFFSTQEDIEDEYTEMGLDLTNVPTPLQYLFALIHVDPRLKSII